jgi:putative NADH-flavin reductase
MLRVAHFGPTGNLGAPTFEHVTSRGHQVTVFVRSRERFHQLHGHPEVEVVEGDARDARAVCEMLAGARFDAVVSTAGCVDNAVQDREDAQASSFCTIFNNLVDASERYLAAPHRAVFLGGMTALSLPGTGNGVRLQSLLERRSPQYGSHVLNHERLLRSSLDWTLVCPAYMVDDAPAWDPTELRLSEDVVPAFGPSARFRRWQLARPFRLPFVLLPVSRRQGELTVPYASVARALVDHLEPNGRFSRRCMGLANPPGRTLKKGEEQRARERAGRAARDAEYDS